MTKTMTGSDSVLPPATRAGGKTGLQNTFLANDHKSVLVIVTLTPATSLGNAPLLRRPLLLFPQKWAKTSSPIAAVNQPHFSLSPIRLTLFLPPLDKVILACQRGVWTAGCREKDRKGKEPRRERAHGGDGWREGVWCTQKNNCTRQLKSAGGATLTLESI